MGNFKKTKNKKEGKMNKKKLLSLALVGTGLLGLTAGNSIAGVSVPPKTVALEIIPVSSDNTTGPVQSNQIIVDGILAVSGMPILLQLNNGYFPKNATIGLCLGDNTLVAKGTVSATDNNTVTLNAIQTISSTSILRVVSNETNPTTFNCTYNSADGVPVKIKGGLNVGDTVELTIGTSKGILFQFKQQYTATLQKASTDYIDPEQDYKALKVGKTSSSATYYINESQVDVPVDKTNGNFAISLNGNFNGVQYAKVSNSQNPEVVILNDTNNWTNATKISSFLGSDNNGTIAITVTGNDTLTPRTFTVSLKTVLGSGNIAREIPLLQNVVSHEWLLPGATYYLPFVVSRQSDETYIVLQARKGVKPSYNVTISALDDNGDFKSIDTISMNAGDRLVIKASDIKAKIPSLTKDKFAVIINVDGDESQIFAYAHVCNANGCRRVPVKTQNGKLIE
jgi:hypothetical protein